jgi:hypothetical protein
MRTTLDIDDDVLHAAKDLARREHTSAGAVISRLARDALTGRSRAPQAVAAKPRRGVAGFRPFPSRGTVVTNEAIDTLRDAEGV